MRRCASFWKNWRRSYKIRSFAFRCAFQKDGIDILSEYSCGVGYFTETDWLIKNATIIDGVLYVQLEELAKWKKTRARDKEPGTEDIYHSIKKLY